MLENTLFDLSSRFCAITSAAAEPAAVLDLVVAVVARLEVRPSSEEYDTTQPCRGRGW